ncbi:MAG: LamG domain-containing protein [Planctomycetota bacterium]|jgi:hypothetical protein
MCKKSIFLVSAVLVLALAAASPAGLDDDPNLVAWWKFDGDATDSSGNDLHGTLMGNPAPVFVGGMIGQALDTTEPDGPGYVEITGYQGILGGSPFSITAWINTSDSSGTFMGWGSTAGGTTRFEFRPDADELRAESSGNVQGMTKLPDNEWIHIAVTVKENSLINEDYVTLYLNGEVDNDVATGGNAALEMAAGNDVTIARRHTSGRWFDALIDDVRLYSRELTPEEIKMLATPPRAHKPIPEDDSILGDTWISLGWSPSYDAVSHDVYVGTNFDDVNDGTGETFQGNQTSTDLLVGFPGYLYPEGLPLATTYYWRVDEVLADGTKQKGDVWSFFAPPREAFNPSPADGTVNEDRDVTLSWLPGMSAVFRNVYFGDNFDDVNSAVGGPPVLETTYTPGLLAADTVYYWRVDEFDGAATHKGDVWSFTTLPDIPITDPNLVVWYKFNEDGTKVLDWSGQGNHGTLMNSPQRTPGFEGDSLYLGTDNYVAITDFHYDNVSGISGVAVAAWVRTYTGVSQIIASFDRNEYWRLQINGEVATPGQVGWHVWTDAGQSDYGSVRRVDDGQWHHICGVFDKGLSTIYIDGEPEPSQMVGTSIGQGDIVRYGYVGTGSESTSFNAVPRTPADYIQGEVDEVRIYDRALTQEEIAQIMRVNPLAAWGHQPNGGVFDLNTAPGSLAWTRGDSASQHDVYFSTDIDATESADASDTTGVYRGRQAGTTYVPPEGFDWGQTYYWRIDEFNNDGTITEGGIRVVEVTDFLVVDDFEDYNDFPPDEIWSTWIDGFETTTNGAMAGHPDPVDPAAGSHYVETGIVHSRAQSMPLFYDTNFKFSEAARTFASPSDWTRHGVEELTLWYFGDPCNVVAERMYVAVTGGGTAVVYDDDPNLVADTWTEWVIPLQTLTDQGVNLRSVTGIALGFGTKGDATTPGSSGVVFFDDIRLRRAPVIPVITAAPLSTMEADVDPADPATLVSVLSINGIDASALIVGTTTTDFEKHAGHEAVHADNLDLTTYASLDDSTFVSTVFAQPVTTIFIMERGANDSGFFQALDTDGNPIGDQIPFTAADFQLPDADLKIVGQPAGGIAVTSDVPIGGLMILPPEGGVHSIDPASISAVPAP